jgi:hypothetical protein
LYTALFSTVDIKKILLTVSMLYGVLLVAVPSRSLNTRIGVLAK